MAGHTIILIGAKPFMNYITNIVANFTAKGISQMQIKARGKFIARAVDIAEVVVKRSLKDQVEIKQVKIDSEEFVNKEGRSVRVSHIEIILKKINKN